MSRDVTPIHATDHRRGGPDPMPVRATLHIKVFSDDPDEISSIVTAGANKFVFAIADDMEGLALRRVAAFVTTPSSSGRVQVQIRNRTQVLNLLSTPVQVDAGDTNSRTSTVEAVTIASIENEWADEIAIDVLEAGSGAVGLGVILEFA